MRKDKSFKLLLEAIVFGKITKWQNLFVTILNLKGRLSYFRYSAALLYETQCLSLLTLPAQEASGLEEQIAQKAQKTSRKCGKTINKLHKLTQKCVNLRSFLEKQGRIVAFLLIVIS